MATKTEIALFFTACVVAAIAVWTSFESASEKETCHFDSRDLNNDPAKPGECTMTAPDNSMKYAIYIAAYGNSQKDIEQAIYKAYLSSKKYAPNVNIIGTLPERFGYKIVTFIPPPFKPEEFKAPPAKIEKRKRK